MNEIAEVDMDAQTADFSLEVQGVTDSCPAGERYAKEQIEKKTIPVLSCEGPCIRQTLGPSQPLVVPILTGPTDSRHWSRAGTKNVYRFSL